MSGIMDYTPLGNQLILEKPEVKKMTATGIALPDSAIRLPTTYKVLKVGSGQMNGMTGQLVPMILKEGDWVVVNPAVIDKPRVLIDGVEEEIFMIVEGDAKLFKRD